MNRIVRTLAAGTASACVAACVTSCSVGLDQMPLPAPSAGRQTYPVTATFTDALNLPAKAKVRLSGADVGEVESMAARNYQAVVTMKIASDVRIPVGTRAELRSATPLGDVFVALSPPAQVTSASPTLQPGDSIPVDDTASAASVEEVLSTAALLVNGGAIRNLTKVINGMGAAVGGKGDDLQVFLDESTRLIQSMSDRSQSIKAALAQTGDVAATLSERQTAINDALAAASPALSTLSDNTNHIVDLITQVNRITLQLAKLPSVRGEESRSMMADINRLSAALNDASQAPGASLANFNLLFGPIIKLTNSTSSNVDIDLADLAVGAFADPYHPADPGSRAPTREDFRNMVGSITYELIRVRNKFWGAPTPPPGNVPPPDLIGPAPGSLAPAPPRTNLLAPHTPAPEGTP
ncbi:MlaD family protein [Mycolicibacterium confluentis]|nr:MCE family protein [Mycolicibacterium confluentis]MCV7318317.1 MCE family protein [Mycolicibacterium confluentis]ORV29630.1 mammalian cell entry protein [Mycolicibacterium confluentis]